MKKHALHSTYDGITYGKLLKFIISLLLASEFINHDWVHIALNQLIFTYFTKKQGLLSRWFWIKKGNNKKQIWHCYGI